MKESSVRLTIFNKLLFSIVGISAVIISSLTFFINMNFKTELQSFVNRNEVSLLQPLQKKLNAIYDTNHDWHIFIVDPQRWEEIVASANYFNLGIKNTSHFVQDYHRMRPNPFAYRFDQPRRLPVEPNDAARDGPILFPSLESRIGLLDKDKKAIIKPSFSKKERKGEWLTNLLPLRVNNKVVGWISLEQRKDIGNPLVDAFYQKQLRVILIVSLLAIIFSVLISYFLMHHFLHPLHALRHGASALAKGNLQYHIPITTSDEFAEVTQHFNQLATTLEKQKEIRNQWLSDISHELRTPVAVLRSEIEAIQDGIRSADNENLALLHQQIINLSQLINDLHQLSLSDAGMQFNFEPCNLLPMIQKQCELHKPRFMEKNIQLNLVFDSDQLFNTTCDKKAILQVLTNLLENSFRYTNVGGQTQVSLKVHNDNYELCVEDTLPGVPDQALPKLFNRLYRVDKSRNRARGGSGLGLAICQQIIDAHHGTITATHSELGGLKIVVILSRKME